jgi:hypothetical protein
MLKVSPEPVTQLRDIRPDLRDRLRVATAQRDHMRSTIATLESAVALLEQMLAQEDQRYAAASGSAKAKPTDSLPDFILETLRAGHRTKDSLRLAAQEAGYEIDGRSVHASLVNLIKRGQAVEKGGGIFAAADKV